MKKIMLVATLAAITACSQAQAPADADTADEEPEAVAEVAAADGGPAYGQFKITNMDGELVATDDVREDGTYTATTADGEETTGTWVQKPGEYCVTADEEGASERCHKESINEDGVWISIDPEGEEVVVERIEAAE